MEMLASDSGNQQRLECHVNVLADAWQDCSVVDSMPSDSSPSRALALP